MDFDAVVDHLAIMHIMSSKVEPATIRIKGLLEVLSSYSFNLYYIKEKDMILSDFLSRQNIDDSNPHEIIPISFNLRAVLQDKYYNLEGEKERYMIQTRSQSKTSGVQKSIISSDEAVLAVDPILPIPLTKVPRSEGLLPYILLRNRPPPKPPDQLINKQDIGDTKMDIEENSPFQENIISEIYERPNKSYFQEPVELKDLIDTRNIIQ